MEIKKASEAAKEMERFAVETGIDLEKFRAFAKAVAEAASVVFENFKRLRDACVGMLKKAKKKTPKKYNAKAGFEPVKMMSQVMCRKPRFLVRKII